MYVENTDGARGSIVYMDDDGTIIQSAFVERFYGERLSYAFTKRTIVTIKLSKQLNPIWRN